MAAFSFQQQNYPLFLDSLFYSNPPTTTTINNNNNNCLFPQFYQLENHPYDQGNTSMDVSVHDISSSIIENSQEMFVNNNNETSVTNKQSPASSSVLKLESDEQISLKLLDKKRKCKNGSNSLNSAQSKNTSKVKSKIGKKQKRSINGDLVEEDKKGKENKKVADQEGPSPPPPPPPPTGYIHVRARRGQATDSHSLAERVRREKISERMKLLQAIVPGCDKVTGKALMLDEIINYVQSLQNQVEFLSMKLASVNPMFYDFGVDLDAFMIKPESLKSLEPQMQINTSVQQCSPTGSANTFTTPNNYPLVDSSATATAEASLVLQQGQQIHNILSQGNGQILWGVDDQGQKLNNQSTLNNNLCSFH